MIINRKLKFAVILGIALLAILTDFKSEKIIESSAISETIGSHKSRELDLIEEVLLFEQGSTTLFNVLSHYNYNIDSAVIDISDHKLFVTISKMDAVLIENAIVTILTKITSGKLRSDSLESKLFELVCSLEIHLYRTHDKSMSTKNLTTINQMFDSIANKISVNGPSLSNRRINNVIRDISSREIIDRVNGFNREFDREKLFVGLMPTSDYYDGRYDAIIDVVSRFGVVLGKYRIAEPIIKDKAALDLFYVTNNSLSTYGNNLLVNNVPSSEFLSTLISIYKTDKIAWRSEQAGRLLFHYTMLNIENMPISELNIIIDAFKVSGQYDYAIYLYKIISEDDLFRYLVELAQSDKSQISIKALRYLANKNILTRAQIVLLLDLWSSEGAENNEGLLVSFLANRWSLTAEDRSVLYSKYKDLTTSGLKELLELYRKDSAEYDEILTVITSQLPSNIDLFFNRSGSYVFGVLGFLNDSRYLEDYFSSYFLSKFISVKKLSASIPDMIGGDIVNLKVLASSGGTDFYNKSVVYDYETYLFDWVLSEAEKFRLIIEKEPLALMTFRAHYNSSLRRKVRSNLDGLCMFRADVPDRVVKYRLNTYRESYLNRHGSRTRILYKLSETQYLTPILKEIEKIIRMVDDDYVSGSFIDCVNGVSSKDPSNDFTDFLKRLKIKALDNDIDYVLNLVSDTFHVERDFGGMAEASSLEYFKLSMLHGQDGLGDVLAFLNIPYIVKSKGVACSVVSYPEDFQDSSVCFKKEGGLWKFSSLINGGD